MIAKNHYARAVAAAYNVTSRFVRKARQGREPQASELMEKIRNDPSALNGHPSKDEHDKKYHPQG